MGATAGEAGLILGGRGSDVGGPTSEICMYGRMSLSDTIATHLVYVLQICRGVDITLSRPRLARSSK